jgi:2'-5' RNA ligase
MPRLVVVLPLSPLHLGDSFAVQDWPLHITVLPPFLTDAAPAEIAAAIAEATSTQPAMTAIAGGEAMFGRRENIPVTVIADTEPLTRLHRVLAEAVRPFAASPDEPAFTGPGFRAHVTVKRDRRVHEGDPLSLTQVALVDMAPRSAPSGRTVLATFPLRTAP